VSYQAKGPDIGVWHMEEVPKLQPFWRDGAAVGAAIVAGLALSQCSLIGLPRSRVSFPDQGNVLLKTIHLARNVLDRSAMIGFSLAVAGLVRVLREPSHCRRLLVRQPGVAACAAVAAALAAGAVNTAVWGAWWIEFQSPWVAPHRIFFPLAQRHVSNCVLGVWAFLALSGLQTRGRNWVNWLGWTLGVTAVVNSVVWYFP
jgi:hypothetical protein